MKDNQWRIDMNDGVDAAFKTLTTTHSGRCKLIDSITDPIDEERMRANTVLRTNGRVDGQPVERTSGYEHTALGGAFKRAREEGRVWSRFHKRGDVK